ncbi:CAF17-like 4Fe-4S cluster assembly/insertion protein YgfZ [Verrucomicrobiota bacterium sgz303538]
MSTTLDAYRQFQQRGGVIDLSARTKLRFTGADRVRYVNGQVTNNVTRLRPGESLPACVTTAKGKLSADVFISAGQDALLVDADAELRESLHARLERYIIADDVTIEDVTDEYALFHLIGGDLPSTPPLPGTQLLRTRRFGEDGVDIVVPTAEAEALRTHLSASRALLDEALVETLRIERGIPRWGRELTEDTLPPEAGLDRTHIDYHKGCYIGQEVISRIRSVGHVNRQLTGFEATDNQPLAPGMRLFSSADPERQLGVVTSAAWSFAMEKAVALGYLKRGSPTDDLLALPADADAPAVHVAVRQLPLTS